MKVHAGTPTVEFGKLALTLASKKKKGLDAVV
jgi:hypothetical protein